MSAKILRDYQRQAVRAFWDTLAGEPVNRVAMEMATGLGKTVTAAGAVDEWLTGVYSMDRAGSGIFRGYAAGRVLFLVHTDELVRQSVSTLKAVVGNRWTVGVVKATRNEVDSDIVVASVATLRQLYRCEQIKDVGLIVVDECHHATAPTYQAILAHFGAFTQPVKEAGCDMGDQPCSCERERAPGIPVLGLTATLARSDGANLGQVWQALPFTRSLPWAIRKGHLIDLVPYTITIPDVAFSNDPAALDAQVAESIAPEAVVDAWLEHTVQINLDTDNPAMYRPRPSTVLFAPLVASAQRFADAFNEAGVKAEVVSDRTHPDERRAILERYEAGVTTVVCNAMVLTEGWDSPRTMCVIVARPCRRLPNGSAPPLFIQMVGRGARPWLEAEAPPREDQFCTVLCLSDMSGSLATVADLSDRPGMAAEDGKPLTQMEDEWDLGRDLTPDELVEYRGPLKVERWDALVQASSKAWKYTEGGVPFLPTAKRSQGYVFVVERDGAWTIWDRGPDTSLGRMRTRKLAQAPDLELAMALAEDEAQELGGDIGALLADKGRAWRKAVPSTAMIEHAQRLGIDTLPIMESRAGGKAGKLSDLIDRVQATRVLDPVAAKIKARV